MTGVLDCMGYGLLIIAQRSGLMSNSNCFHMSNAQADRNAQSAPGISAGKSLHVPLCRIS